MQTRKIGSLDVSIIGLGCNNFSSRIDFDATGSVVNAALDAGINFFDTADRYGKGQSEEFLGRVLGKRRDQILIATKFGMEMGKRQKGAKPDYVKEACEASLRRLGTDRIDLYQLHQPDPETPVQDTLGALDDLMRAGKVREIGCSNFSLEQLRQAAAITKGRAHFVSVQNEFSLLHREPERTVLPECERAGLAFLPYFPLVHGLLSGKYRKGHPPPPGSRIARGYGEEVFTKRNLEMVDAMIDFAQSRNHTILQLAFGWLLAHKPVSSVIAGASTPEQVKSNAAAGDAWQLTDTDLAEIDKIVLGE